MELNDILKILEDKADKIYSDTPHLYAHCRELALKWAIENKLIKGYRCVSHRQPNQVYFGSCVGSDRMYKIWK